MERAPHDLEPRRVLVSSDIRCGKGVVHDPVRCLERWYDAETGKLLLQFDPCGGGVTYFYRDECLP